MKKFLCLVLALAMLLTLFACGKKDETKEDVNETITLEDTASENTDTPEVEEPEEPEEDAEDATENEADAPSDEQVSKPEVKPETKPEAEKPVAKPEVKPEAEKPEVKPEEEKPAEKPAATLGDAMLAAFRANASKGDAESIANAVVASYAFPFPVATVPVEEGLLMGFDNAEIKGFSKGAMFGPTISTQPFIGYVFELASGTDADSFISTLKAAANLRWNICTAAEQMVAEKSGNKVFFVMCPTAFAE